MPIPQINLKLPRPITSLHQIELTSRCNLRCRYCVHSGMPRPKIDMTEETFLQALYWVNYFRDRGTQGELNLAGIGESTMHPRFTEWLPLAREAVGSERLIIATNGVSFTEDIARAAAESDLRVVVSLHRPEVAAGAITLARRYGIFSGVSADPSMNPNDWAGQVDWEPAKTTLSAQISCPWIRGGWAFCMADGRISHCCLDADGSGCFTAGDLDPVDDSSQLDVFSDLANLYTAPWKLCTGCYQEIGVVGYDQHKLLPVIKS